MKLTENQMYQAFMRCDNAFEGAFFVAVKTTGIFCRPTCKARKPKRKNVEFFETSKLALIHGYRPCKLCYPLLAGRVLPEEITQLVKEVSQNPAIRISDQDLRERGMEPNRVRRWFIKEHGMTFHAYQRMVRINTAFKKIKRGHSVTHTAFDSGYDSLSGFSDSFKALLGTSPGKIKDQNIIDLVRMETPIGTMVAGATDAGICLLEFTDRRMLETEFNILKQRLNAVILQGENMHFDALRRQLSEYFDGQRRSFSVPLVLTGTPFQIQVWQALTTIPIGETRSYQQQANALQRPKAVRAVANANGMNKISILVPCHRVIGSDGSLTGYGGGLWRKQWLLDHEACWRE